MPAGTYWSDALERHVEPTDPDWSAEKFADLVSGTIGEATQYNDNNEGMNPCAAS